MNKTATQIAEEVLAKTAEPKPGEEPYPMASWFKDPTIGGAIGGAGGLGLGALLGGLLGKTPGAMLGGYYGSLAGGLGGSGLGVLSAKKKHRKWKESLPANQEA